MRLLHLSLASLLGSAVGLLLLLAITIQSTSALNSAKTDLDALFELRHRIDNLSVAAGNILLFGASPTLWQRLRTDAEDIEQRLQALSNEQPDAAGVAYRIRTLTDALTMLRATSAGAIGHTQTPGATGDGEIEPLQMSERARILLSQIAGHGVMVDEAMGLMLTERREAITREGTRIVVRLALSALVLGLLSIGAFSLIYWRIAAPVRSLAKTVERVSQGDLSARSMVKGRDELAMLASALNRMLDQLSASETRLQQYRELVEGSDDLMAIADAEYRYLLVNQSYARMFGRDPSQIEGAYLWEILGRGYFDAVLKEKLDHCLSGQSERFETERRDRDGAPTAACTLFSHRGKAALRASGGCGHHRYLGAQAGRDRAARAVPAIGYRRAARSCRRLAGRPQGAEGSLVAHGRRDPWDARGLFTVDRRRHQFLCS
jgi:PAS domain S-box-containing protein